MAQTDVAQVEPALAKRDFIIAAALGVAGFLTVKFTAAGGMDPSQWSEAAAAAGLKPPQFVFPGVWRLLVHGVFSVFGISWTVEALSWAGAAVAGLSSALVYCIVKTMTGFLTRHSDSHAVWKEKILPGFAALAAALTCLADPFINASQTFSPEQLRFLLLLLILHTYFRWLTVGGTMRLWTCVALTGVMAAETPFAFVLPVVLLWGYFATWGMSVNELYTPPDALADPDELPRWRIFFLFLGVMAATVWANVWIFDKLGGAAANGWEQNDVFFRYAVGYGRMLLWASSAAGWILGLGFCVLPAVVAYKMLPGTLRDDMPMRFSAGAILVFMAFLAFLQSGAVPHTRFWVFAGAFAPVRSGFLLMVFVLCMAATLAMAGAAFAFECQMMYVPESSGMRPGAKLRCLVPFLALVLTAAAGVNLPRSTEREMHNIVYDTIKETLDECGDAKWIFTDGRLDDGLLLMAAAEGKALKPLDMLSGPAKFDQSLREGNFPAGSADRDTIAIGTAALFRTWAGEKEGGLDDSAIQFGFDFWKRANKPLPKISGIVARTAGMDDEAAAKGVANIEKIVQRMLEVAKDAPSASPSPALADAFAAAQWRISRLARLREDTQTADNLDAVNMALQRTKNIVEIERQKTFMQLTPHEGLMLALHRGDFVEAKRYASAVLRNNENDPDACFGTGMGYVVENDFENAEIFLRRVLNAHPDDPVTMNNLSIVIRKQGRFDEAADLARKALEKLPDSPEVKRTLDDAVNKKK